MKLRQIEEANKARRSRFFNSKLFIMMGKVVSPKVNYVKREVRILMKSRIFQLMLAFPCLVLSIKFYLMFKRKYSEGGLAPNLGYANDHPVSKFIKP